MKKIKNKKEKYNMSTYSQTFELLSFHSFQNHKQYQILQIAQLVSPIGHYEENYLKINILYLKLSLSVCSLRRMRGQNHRLT